MVEDLQRSNGHAHPLALRNVTSAGAGRELPRNLEAEAYLISCCFFEDSGAETIARARAAGITSKSFYDWKHSMVFDRICSVIDAGLGVGVAAVAVSLAAQTLHKIGGIPFLTEISGLVPTSAEAGVFIEKVREQALLREMIRSAMGAVEDCYGFAGGIDEFVGAMDRKLKFSGLAGGGSLLTRLETVRYDPARRLPDVAAVFSLAAVAVCTRGNITTLTALSKTGKTSFLAAMLASTFLDADHGGDVFTVRGLNAVGHAVVHFDTEMHGKHHERMMDGVLKRAEACCRYVSASLASFLRAKGSICLATA